MSRRDIPAAHPLVGPDERAAVDRVMRSGMIAQGPEVAAFEAEFAAALVGGRTCVAVNSGTAGLHLGLLAADLAQGDEVIVPSFTFAATANAVVLAGATPVFADIDPATFCLDPESVVEHVTGRTVGMMPVHLYGQAADMTRFAQLSERLGLQIFEDAAQAHGAAWDGKPVGTFGTFAMFSLYPTKNMTSGEGGMVSADDAGVLRRLRLLRNQGMERRYENEIVGFNARMTDLHAAIGRVQLGKLPAWNKQRQENAKFYDANLRGVVTPPVSASATHVYHQYTIRVLDDRDGFAAALANEHGVGSGVYYPIPNHELPSLANAVDLPHTRVAAREVLSLPVHPALSQGDLERVVDAVNTLATAGA